MCKNKFLERALVPGDLGVTTSFQIPEKTSQEMDSVGSKKKEEKKKGEAKKKKKGTQMRCILIYRQFRTPTPFPHPRKFTKFRLFCQFAKGKKGKGPLI